MKYLGTITDSKDLTTKEYVDGQVSGVSTSLTNHIGDNNNPHKVTKSQVGLGNVEDKSSETIRGEITKGNVTTALGYTPPETDTTYTTGTESYSGTTKLYTGTGTGTDGTMTQNAITTALSNKIDASDLPDLSTVIFGEGVSTVEAPATINADTLEGHSASYFATATQISDLATVASTGSYADLTNRPNDNQIRAIYVGTDAPTSTTGNDGDIYIQYSS